MKTRNAVMEGRFYPSTGKRIFDQIRAIEESERYPEVTLSADRVFGAILPHAGHVYSGYQTIPFFQYLKSNRMCPETFVIVHPNHTGLGESLAVDDSDRWRNSAGDISIDRVFADALALPRDALAHSREHSAEVIIPYLQYYLEAHSFSIVPICMREQNLGTATSLARFIQKAAEETGRRIMVLASSDFSHFLSPESGRIKDQKVLDQILDRDAGGVETAVIGNGVSVCGYGPIMTLMKFAELKQKEYKMKVLARGHSGEVAPSSEVVDYISMIFYT